MSEPAGKAPISRDPAAVTRRILDAAEAEFMASGYEAASTNRITAAFGGSKATLFRHFATKQDLLEAVIRRIAERWRGRVGESGAGEEPRRWLTAFAADTLRWILGDDALFVGRLGIAEGHKFPELAGVFHQAAGAPLQAALAGRLEGWTRAGLLACADPAADARAFMDLAVSGAVSRALYGAERLEGAALDEHAARAVDLFLEGRAGRFGNPPL